MPRLVTAIVESVTAVAPKTSLLFVITIMTAASKEKIIVSTPNLTQGITVATEHVFLTSLKYLTIRRIGELGVGSWELGVGSWELGVGE
jgi:hypothetical protein